MTFRNDPLFEMLDTATADRMLDGAVLPEDAPPGYEQVALLLSAPSRPDSRGESSRHAQPPAPPTSPQPQPAGRHYPSHPLSGLSQQLAHPGVHVRDARPDQADVAM